MDSEKELTQTGACERISELLAQITFKICRVKETSVSMRYITSNSEYCASVLFVNIFVTVTRD